MRVAVRRGYGTRPPAFFFFFFFFFSLFCFAFVMFEAWCLVLWRDGSTALKNESECALWRGEIVVYEHTNTVAREYGKVRRE